MSESPQFLIYQSEDGTTRVDVRLQAQALWLSQKQLTELFGKAKGTISEHIKHIFEDGELEPGAVVRLFRTTAAEGQAMRRIAMTMVDWITKLEGFLSLNDREILHGAGKVSAQLAKAHAEHEFDKFRVLDDEQFESDFDRMIKLLPAKPQKRS